jgi:phosphoglycerol transferase MdoB-like AlkP superfamily enzyme
MVIRDYQALAKRLGFVSLFYIFYRVFFYIYNYSYFKPFSFIDTFYAFIYGFRFDLSTVLIANLFFIVGSLIPITHHSYRLLIKWIYILFNTFFLGVIVTDIEFFGFLGKKMTFDIFDMKSDIENQFIQIVSNYWPFVFLIILNGVLLFWLYPRRKKEILFERPMKLYKSLITGVIIFIFVAIGIRGGVQLRSISPKEAFVHKHYELGNLTLNAAYSMIRSIGKKGIKKEKYFKSDMEAKEYILKNRTFENTSSVNLGKQNVVILIIESLSQEYINKGYTPFISELSKRSLYFDKNMANGRRSLEALPSIMAAFPSIIGKPIYQSQYQSNQFFALPKLLKENGYETSFFHGGKRGTMDFDAYCLSIGFDKYHALEDYPNQDHFDGHWGIYDNYYLNYFLGNLDTHKEPFFTSIFTLSSHQPYSIPALYKNKFKKGNLEIHESIGYIDHSLKEFFDKASKKPWYKNTLFILTADHTQKLESNEFNNEIGRYRVPLLFFHPELDLSTYKSRRLTHHADILPSTLDFLNIKYDKKLLFGSSVFSNSSGRVLNFISGNYFYYKNNKMMRYDGDNAQLFEVNDNMSSMKPLSNSEVSMDLLNELKAYIQYTNNGLKFNSLYR